jgi:hypothetical protein
MARAHHIQTDDKGLVRDMDSKALLATDKSALQRHRRQQHHQKRYAELETKVARLSSLVNELLNHG